MKRGKNQPFYKPFGNTITSLKGSKGCTPIGCSLRTAIANAYHTQSCMGDSGDPNKIGKNISNRMRTSSGNENGANILLNRMTPGKASNQGDLTPNKSYTNAFKINSKSINALLDNIIMEEFFTECSKPKLNPNAAKDEESTNSEYKSNLYLNNLPHSKTFSKSISEVSSLSQTHLTTSVSEKLMKDNYNRNYFNKERPEIKQPDGDKVDDHDTIENLSLEHNDRDIDNNHHNKQENDDNNDSQAGNLQDSKSSEDIDQNSIFFVKEETNRDVFIRVEKNTSSAILSLVSMFPDKNIHIKQNNVNADIAEMKQDAFVNTDMNESTLDNEDSESASSMANLKKSKTFFPRKRKFYFRSKTKKALNEVKMKNKSDDLDFKDLASSNFTIDKSDNDSIPADEMNDKPTHRNVSEQEEFGVTNQREDAANVLHVSVQENPQKMSVKLCEETENAKKLEMVYPFSTPKGDDGSSSNCSLVISDVKPLQKEDESKLKNSSVKFPNYLESNLTQRFTDNGEDYNCKDYKLFCDNDFYTWFKRICDNEESLSLQPSFHLENQMRNLKLSDKVPISFISDKQQEEWFTEPNKLPKLARTKIYRQHRCRTVAHVNNKNIYQKHSQNRSSGNLDSSSCTSPDSRTPNAGCYLECKFISPGTHCINHHDTEIQSVASSSSCSCFTESTGFNEESNLNLGSVNENSSTVFIDGLKKKRMVFQPKMINMATQNAERLECEDNENCFQNASNESKLIHTELKKQKKCKLLSCFP